MRINPGLYDDLITPELRAVINAAESQGLVPATDAVELADVPSRIAALASFVVERELEREPESSRLARAVELLAALQASLELAPGSKQPERLRSLVERTPAGDPAEMRRPQTPLGSTTLMTNGQGQPSVGHEIASEIDSADRIDIVVAFIRWSGIRTIAPALKRHVERGRSIRVLTTTYTGSTELRALQELEALGAEVRVSYDTSSTRLHAKAWHFHRSSGLSTVYVGSSNLTHSAQAPGLEWNVRASQRLNPDLIADFDRTFETYWADAHFEQFDPARFAESVKVERSDAIETPFAIQPFPFQRQILERLEVERRRGFANTLVVAATGTGKTVVAGLDYRSLRQRLSRSRLLFIAHRKEILEQSRTTFRHVLNEGSFGELWVDGERPSTFDHVFASVQSLSQANLVNIDPKHFDVVIVDEFHHAAAATYDRLLEHLEPQHLVGLTATPERPDGLDVTRWFAGRVAVDLRLWDALAQGLLAPFHYFGIHDGTDLSDITWRRGRGYDTGELTNLYTADHAWASKVITALKEKVGDPRSMKALGFCASVEHARFMAERFSAAGLPSVTVTGSTPSGERANARRELQSGSINAIFTVDVFNEGVDIPAVDTILMLRPTESATIFMQQLGRGLRRFDGKDVVTVLDYVGHQRDEFRFDLRYRQLLGRTRRELERDVRDGFPVLPAGSEIHLDAESQQAVLNNLRRSVPSTKKQLVDELRRLGDVDLRTFLYETGLELEDVFRGDRTWGELRRLAAGRPEGAEGENPLRRGVGRLLHLDDDERIEELLGFTNSPLAPAVNQLSVREQRRLEGLLLTILSPKKGTFESLQAAADHVWSYPNVVAELSALGAALSDRIRHLHRPIGVPHPVPLQLHARYSREEILAAFGASTVVAPLPLQTGTYWHEPTRTFLMFITLKKTEQDFSPSTRYRDYAVSEDLFHWEANWRYTAETARGLDYIHHEERGMAVQLFVRPTKAHEGRTTPYFVAGAATYVEHRSDDPLEIVWRLKHSLPGDEFAAFRAAIA